MGRFIFLFLLCLSASVLFGQNTDLTATPTEPYENVSVNKIYSDSLSSTFVIHIKKEVPLHKHLHHTEQVYILSGTGLMRLDDLMLEIKAGDFIVIPKGSVHGVTVTSSEPLKVLSIQSPMFDGTDRILITE